MKPLIVCGVIVALLNSAWIVEGTDNNCAAVERLAVRQVSKKDEKPEVTAMTMGLISLSNGRFAAMKASQVSSLPVPLVCLSVYWGSTLDGTPGIN